jgi:exopolysaccharide production protein ExoZ
MAVTALYVPATETSTIGVERGKLFHLQALRGLAASLVVLSHGADALAQRGLISREVGDRLGISGYFGVATFFIISGFIIHRSSAGAFGDLRRTADFVAKRLIRIVPVYWIATALFVVLSPHRAGYTWRDVVCSLLFVPHELGSAPDLHPLVGQGWTLQYEMQFYLIFTVGLLLGRRAGTWLIVAALAGLVVAGGWLMPLSAMEDPMTLATFWTRPILLLFVAGIGIAALAERSPRWVTIPCPFALTLFVLALWFVYSLDFPASPGALLQFPAVIVVWALGAAGVFVSIFGRSNEGWSERLAERFGDASYSVYLFHTFILSALLRLKVPEHSPVLFVLAALVGSNVFGYAVYCVVERPILRTLRGRLRFTSRPGSSVPRHLPVVPR